jgi:3-methyladenine DNA glycosylase AlkD
LEDIIHSIRQELRANSDEKTRSVSKRFFKERIIVHGVKSATVRKISKEHFKHIQTRSKSEIFALCEALWQSGYLEESFVACHWSHYIHKQYAPEDFQVFERWINQYISNWATCDTFCNHTVGDFIQMYPSYLSKLKEFTGSENRWTHRAAAVSLILYGKYHSHYEAGNRDQRQCLVPNLKTLPQEFVKFKIPGKSFSDSSPKKQKEIAYP